MSHIQGKSFVRVNSEEFELAGFVLYTEEYAAKFGNFADSRRLNPCEAIASALSSSLWVWVYRLMPESYEFRLEQALSFITQFIRRSFHSDFLSNISSLKRSLLMVPVANKTLLTKMFELIKQTYGRFPGTCCTFSLEFSDLILCRTRYNV